MLLDATTKSLEIYLGAAVTTNQLQFVTFYVDHTSSAATPGASDGVTNSTTPVTLVAAPLASTQRQVKEITVYNADTVSATVYLRLNNNSTYRTLIKTILASGETLVYQNEIGWNKMNGLAVRVPTLVYNNVRDAANLTAVTAFATGTCHCYYMGPAASPSATVNLLANVTTGVATITWAEIALYKGTPVLNGNCPDLTRLGWANVAAIYNSTGIKNTLITLDTPIVGGDHLWVVMGSTATTPFQVRGALADNIQSGTFQTLAARPSTTAGPTTGTLAGAAVVPAWIAMKLN